MSIEMPDEYLARLWEDVNWTEAEAKLADLQKRISIAVFGRNWKTVEDTQKRLVNDLDIRCLAVRHVATASNSPGVDGIKWRTPADLMRAAMGLISSGYKASPLRQIKIVAKNNGKERHPALPTYRDRAMQVLHGYSLLPVVEAGGDRKSFGFRVGRSTQDAHAYMVDALESNDQPDIIVCGDIRAYYANIQHGWLMKHVPMDKHVLSEFLNAGIVFAGELFPAKETGISEGSNISPYLGNFVLDGLQRHIFMQFHGTATPEDYGVGNLVRFADDIRITARTQEEGERILDILKAFLAERGLVLSEEKTKICTAEEGFTFLSRTYKRVDGVVYCAPAEEAVERFISELQQIIATNRKSQRELILLLNRKLKGWGNYHRYSEATEAFRRVDAAVQAALLEAAVAMHPRMQLAKIKAKYWYKESDGRHVYALPDDKSVRLFRLADMPLLRHKRIKTSINPFTDPEYLEERTQARAIHNATGPYHAVWERQKGKCYYCGRPILSDQSRTIVPIDPHLPESVSNSAYIHGICKDNEFEILYADEDASPLPAYDVQAALHGILNPPAKSKPSERQKGVIKPSWRHYRLKEHFAACTASSLTYTFKQLEEIDGKPFAKTSRRSIDYWSPRTNCNTIAEAWLTEGYELYNLDIKNEKITLHRRDDGVGHLKIPDVLLQGKLPDNAIYELETHFAYIIDKYGLRQAKKKKGGKRGTK